MTVGDARTDEQLMAAYVAGERAAFGELFARYGPRLVRLFSRDLGGRDEVHDLVQQTFLQLHRARLDFRVDAKLRPWLFTIALNLKRKHFRTVKRRPTSELGEVDPVGNETAPGTPLERLEDQAAVRTALAELPPGTREVIELHWFEGLPFAEVADTVGASLSAVKVRAHRGYKRLRESLAARNPGPGAE